MAKVRPHLTYANVMVTLLAFVVLGGAAYAATSLPKNSVGTKQLRKGAVATGKLRKGAVTGAKVRDGSLTGADVDVAKLGTVPAATSAAEAQHALSADSATSSGDAESLQGLSPQDFLASDRVLYGSRASNSLTSLLLFEVPGGLRVRTDGDADEFLSLTFENVSAHEWEIAAPGTSYPLAAGKDGTISPVAAPGAAAVLMVRDKTDPDRVAALQCGSFADPSRIACLAFLLPL